MKNFQWAIAILLAPFFLSGCSGSGRSLGATSNVQTTKSADYDGTPRKITAVVEAATLDPRFNDAFVDSAGRCGAKLVFRQSPPGQPVEAGDADAVLTIQELGYETSKFAHPGLLNGGSWVSMIRLQFSLTDMSSKKLVWKGQADFRVGDFMGSFHETNPSQRWADDLARIMLKDKIFPACNFNRKTA